MATLLQVEQSSLSAANGARWFRAPYRLLIRTSLALALAAGFSTGLYLVLSFAFGLPLSGGAPALMQVHGQVQTLGFVGLFVMAVGVQLFPRFHSARLDRPALVSAGGLMLAGGMLLRIIGQPMETSAPVRGYLLILSGLLELAGVLLAVSAFARVIRRGSKPTERGWRALLPAAMGMSLLVALGLNLVACIELANGSAVVASAQDEALTHLEVFGFASTMILAVSSRIVPRFLLLKPTREGQLRVALQLWAVGTLGVAMVWLIAPGAPLARAGFALAQLLGSAVFVMALRLYEVPIRPRGMPNVTNPTRRWARIAFAFLLAACAANFGVALADASGVPTTVTELSAARHLLAQGFLLPVIVYMAARILPGYSAAMLHRPRVLGGIVWTLFAAAFLRGIAELLGGYAPGWGVLVATGGALGVAAFAVFAVGLWRATRQAPALMR